MQTTRCWFGTSALVASLAAALACMLLPGTAVAIQSAEASNPSTRLVAFGAGYDQPAGAAPVRALQRRLNALGHEAGPIDGLYGPLTEAAVERFQVARGLQVDGIVGPVTRRAIRQADMARGEGYGLRGGSQRVRVLQRRLATLGHEPGPIDGMYGPLTEAAVTRFQRDSALAPNGIVGPRTLRVLARTQGNSGGSSTRTIDGAKGRQPDKRDQATPSPQADSAQRNTRGSNQTGGNDEPSWRSRPGMGVADRNQAQAGASAPPVLLLAGVLALVLMGATLAVRAAPRRRPLLSDPVPGSRPRFERATTAPGPRSPRSKQPVRGGDRIQAFGYVSVPVSRPLTDVTEQSAAILEICEERGWHLLGISRDVARAELPAMHRPELRHVLGRLAAGEGSCLVVAQLERLSSSAAELSSLLSWLNERRIRLVAVDVQLDTSTAPGRLAADALISVGTWERQRTEGTPEASAQSQPKGGSSNRPAVRDVPALKQHIVDMRARGMTLQAIADRLNAEGVPTLRGGQKWRPSSVQAAAGYHRPPQRPRAGYGGLPNGGAGGRS